ncbi:hypothetical protein BpHYR1_048686 [Brachionus plicatilis]|uniref:Uncharacterized protein n=1 Tax=Brachionus plicatilis TaxID=10195 RepID=A0A3M7S590_BRAPC|nr:hypothetical protein BpHYR1_048686 [Brachionus plicatilis]
MSKKLVIDQLTPLENQEIKVAALNCKRDCLIGMDIIRRIKETINTFSRVNELETESSDVLLSQSTGLLDDTSKNLESEILSELSKVAAESYLDLKQNNVFQHRIQLKDPKTKPIKQKEVITRTNTKNLTTSEKICKSIPFEKNDEKIFNEKIKELELNIEIQSYGSHINLLSITFYNEEVKNNLFLLSLNYPNIKISNELKNEVEATIKNQFKSDTACFRKLIGNMINDNSAWAERNRAKMVIDYSDYIHSAYVNETKF